MHAGRACCTPNLRSHLRAPNRVASPTTRRRCHPAHLIPASRKTIRRRDRRINRSSHLRRLLLHEEVTNAPLPRYPETPACLLFPSASATALLLATAMPGWAAQDLDPQDRQAAFRQLDADGDGWISVQEAAAHPEVTANFEKADRDHDGRLSFEEFETVAINRSDQPGKFRNPDQG